MSSETPATATAGDTIFALSSGAGVAGVAVIRISGRGATQVFGSMIRGERPPARTAQLTVLYEPGDAEPLDQALVLWFPGPKSFTGEDLLELHLHGGRAVVAGVLSALGGLPGFRVAAPGEFTRRAFDADKLDLTEVEGLADLVNAETEAQRRQAFRQMQGALGMRCAELHADLLGALALLEAEIDFAEDEIDVPASKVPAIHDRVGNLLEELEALLADSSRGERLRDGLQIAIIGAPNVGKSSLLNALAQRDVAIVSETAGTTRDVIEVHLDLHGLPVTLADTAGLRDLGDPEAVEAEGIRRARRRAEDADLKLAVFDASQWPMVEPDVAALVDPETLIVVNKRDLVTAALVDVLEGPSPALPEPLAALARRVHAISARTGEGLTALLRAIGEAAEPRLGGGGLAMISRARHREALTACRDALLRASQSEDLELLAEDLRLAMRALGRVTGRVDVEDLLDVIFREFCIGK